MNNPTCLTCQFFSGGECHRYPPQHLSTKVSEDYYLEDGHKVWDTDREEFWAFPEVHDSDWCGEYKMNVLTWLEKTKEKKTGD